MTRLVLLFLHILCTIMNGALTILSENDTSKILYLICTVLWAMCVVVDIVALNQL